MYNIRVESVACILSLGLGNRKSLVVQGFAMKENNKEPGLTALAVHTS